MQAMTTVSRSFFLLTSLMTVSVGGSVFLQTYRDWHQSCLKISLMLSIITSKH